MRLLYKGVTPRDRNVIGYSNFTICPTTDPNSLIIGQTSQSLPTLHRLHIFSIDDVKNFGVFVRQGLQNDEISTWSFHLHNVDYLVVPSDFVGERHLAQLAVHFLELDHNIFAVNFARAL